MIWNLPNTLTWLRIFAIPLVVVFFYLPYKWADPAAGLLFGLAGITDSLDGYLARRMGQTSRLGAFLDPVADKLIVAVALVLLVSKDMPPIFIPGLETIDGGLATLRAESVRVILVLTAIVIIGREIAISALREWMAEIGQRGKVKVSQLGKYKTILQIVGLSCMLFRWDLKLLPGFSAARVRDRSRAHGHRRGAHAHLRRVIHARRVAGSERNRLTRSVCVFCGSAPGARPSYSNAAEELGRALAERSITLVYGGGRLGLMGIVADATLKAGGRVIGVIPRMLIEREVAHPALTTQHVVTTMHERKTLMAELSDGFVGLPGGMGTFDELVRNHHVGAARAARKTRGARKHRELLRADVWNARLRGAGRVCNGRKPGALA